MNLVIFSISAAAILVYGIFILGIARKLKAESGKYKVESDKGGTNAKSDARPHVTIIIPCRNEESQIRVVLESVLRQDYPLEKMEVIVVDDHSEDRTTEVIGEYQRLLPLKILESNGKGKKEALKTGISAASNDLIITTDADSFAGTSWISRMVSVYFSQNLEMLCGLIQLEGIGLFGELQQAESAAVVGISAVMLNREKPATCNGANLMFSKQVFDSVGGYEGHDHLASGDDDLLMHRFAQRDMGKVRYNMDPGAKVHSMTCATIPEFMQQRKRWISKSKAYIYPYNRNIQILVVLQLLGFYAMFYLLFTPLMPIANWLIILKYFADITYGTRLRKFINFKRQYILLMPVFQLYLLPLLLTGWLVKTRWKGRTIS